MRYNVAIFYYCVLAIQHVAYSFHDVNSTRRAVRTERPRKVQMILHLLSFLLYLPLFARQRRRRRLGGVCARGDITATTGPVDV